MSEQRIMSTHMSLWASCGRNAGGTIAHATQNVRTPAHSETRFVPWPLSQPRSGVWPCVLTAVLVAISSISASSAGLGPVQLYWQSAPLSHYPLPTNKESLLSHRADYLRRRGELTNAHGLGRFCADIRLTPEETE